MKRSTYERLLKHLLLPFNCQPYLDALERIFGYLDGEDIISISYELDFPPCIVMRRLLESLPLNLHRQLLPKAATDTDEAPPSPCKETAAAAPPAPNSPATPPAANSPATPPAANSPATPPVTLPASTPVDPTASTPVDPTASTPVEPTASTPVDPTASTPVDPTLTTQPATTQPPTPRPQPSPRDAFEQQIPALPPDQQATARLLLRLHDDARRCVEADTLYAPQADAARHQAGVLYEAKLADRLEELGLAFFTEEVLRAKGFFKTPDVKLQVPIAIEGRLVHWIDSKASFGDDALHSAQYADQYSKYINRFGPGAVVYWFDFLEDLEPQDDLLLLRDIPDTVTTLPQLPLALVNVPLTEGDPPRAAVPVS